MSQTKIIELLKKHPEGLSAPEVHQLLQTTNCYGQLKKLERSGEIIQRRDGRKSRWFLSPDMELICCVNEKEHGRHSMTSATKTLNPVKYSRGDRSSNQ